MQNELIKIQPKFRGTLLTNVETFRKDTTQFYTDYATVSSSLSQCTAHHILIANVFPNQSGPMAEGIPPREASDRLNVFQSRFDELWQKFQIYSDGEELFGLTVTDYPDLARIKKELNLLQKLYGLYNTVMDSIDGYYDILWTEVDIEKINNELLDFQNK